MYRTGDLGRYRDDGTVEFAGRADDQCKIRGFRVETAEVLRAIEEDPRVRSAFVDAQDDPTGGKRLVAYVVVDGEDSLALKELRERLAARLPDYMLPAAFVTLAALPLTPNGKVDRKALPAPSNPLEESLAKIWMEVLKIERVGVNDNFFDIGGHSLLATQVVSRLSKDL